MKNSLYAATVYYQDGTSETKEKFIFSDSINELHDSVDKVKRFLERNKFVFVASIIQTEEEFFDRSFDLFEDDDTVFH